MSAAGRLLISGVESRAISGDDRSMCSAPVRLSDARGFIV